MIQAIQYLSTHKFFRGVLLIELLVYFRGMLVGLNTSYVLHVRHLYLYTCMHMGVYLDIQSIMWKLIYNQ